MEEKKKKKKGASKKSKQCAENELPIAQLSPLPD